MRSPLALYLCSVQAFCLWNSKWTWDIWWWKASTSKPIDTRWKSRFAFSSHIFHLFLLLLVCFFVVATLFIHIFQVQQISSTFKTGVRMCVKCVRYFNTCLRNEPAKSGIIFIWVKYTQSAHYGSLAPKLIVFSMIFSYIFFLHANILLLQNKRTIPSPTKLIRWAFQPGWRAKRKK